MDNELDNVCGTLVLFFKVYWYFKPKGEDALKKGGLSI